jgi:hypothetical protein
VGYREEIFRHEPAAKTGSRKRVKVGGKKKEEIEFTEKRLLYRTSLLDYQRDMIALQRVLFINLFFVQYRG